MEQTVGVVVPYATAASNDETGEHREPPSKPSDGASSQAFADSHKHAMGVRKFLETCQATISHQTPCMSAVAVGQKIKNV